MRRISLMVILMMPVLLWAERPEFLNPDLFARPEKIMILQPRNTGIDDSYYFTRISRRISSTIKQIKRFDTTDRSGTLLALDDVEIFLQSLSATNGSSRSYLKTILDSDQVRTMDYLLIPEAGDYSTNLSVNKYIEVEHVTNDDGVIKKYEHHMVDVESSIRYLISIHIVSVSKGEKVETIHQRISSTQVHSYEISEREYSGNILIDILYAIIDENRISTQKEKAANLPQKNKELALDELEDELKLALNECRTFKVATRIIYQKDKEVYFNQGELWEIQYGDFYSVKQQGLNNTLLEVQQVDQFFSQADVIWGKANSNQVVVQRKLLGMSLQLGSAFMTYEVDPRFEANVISNLLSLPVATVSPVDRWINTFSWNMGYDQLKSFYVLQSLDIHFSEDLNFISLGLKGGYKWQAGRLSLSLGAGLFYQSYATSFKISQTVASNIGMSVDPAGAAEVNLRSSLDIFVMRPECDIRLYVSPHFALRMQAAYQVNMGADFLRLSATQMVPDPDAVDGSLISDNVYKSSLNNLYLVPADWYLNLGLVMVF